MRGKLIDLTGKVFGRLTVLNMAEKAGSRTTWNCLCECGKSAVVMGCNLREGKTRSCSCLMRERISQTNTTHGHSTNGKASRTYKSWESMRERTQRASHKSHKRYAGRGIKCCQRFLESFGEFLADLGERPEGMSLDRIDNNGHYSCGKCQECMRNSWPANCRWLSRVGQSRNMSSNRHLAFRGEIKCVAEWAEILGVDRILVYRRLRDGWSAEKALGTPYLGPNGKSTPKIH